MDMNYDLSVIRHKKGNTTGSRYLVVEIELNECDAMLNIFGSFCDFSWSLLTGIENVNVSAMFCEYVKVSVDIRETYNTPKRNLH